MKENIISIDKWIEPKYKEYSLYTCTKRAIPHLVDGFKPSQRKIIYTAIKRARSLIKVVSLSGYCLAEASYHHGDSSLNDAISLMAQDFVGSNNYPIFNGKGGFGNRYGATPSAPRYVYVKLSDIFDDMFLKSDNPILSESGSIEDPEPLFYVPIIPYVLLNGISGMAVGFSVDIPSYNPKDIIENIENILDDNKTRTELVPFYKGYLGRIEKEADNQFVQYGVFKRLNTTTIEISEVPIGITTEKYKEHLNKLIDNEIIKDYDDYSDTNWKLIIRAPRDFVSKTDDELYTILNLKQKIFERINVIFDDAVIEYKSPIALIEDFVKIRLEYYEKRKNAMLADYKFDILKLFVRYLTNKYIKSKGESGFKFVKEELVEYIKGKENTIKTFFIDLVEGTVWNEVWEVLLKNLDDVLSTIRINELYSDKMEDYQKKIQEFTDIHNILYRKSIKSLYKYDLKQLNKHFGE